MVSTHWQTHHRPSDRELRFLDLLARQAADLIEQRQDEAQRKQLLEREQAAREEAEQANRIKDEFLAVLSHELRSPLNPILGWARLLQGGKLDETRQREALATIERNAKLQTQLIEDLLDISRIIRGKLSLTVAPVNLTFVITAAVETVRLAAKAKRIQILLDLTTAIAPVSGDAARLQQVVWNLLSNAVKFTPNGGQVTVELRQINQLAQIRVMDTGKGISPDFLPHVFDYFRQADATTTRKFGGLGLGLAIVKQIVEMHGGTVGAESPGEEQGATFTVQLPVMQQTPSTVLESSYAETAKQETPLSNLQILVVDDDDDTREFQSFLLEQNGARVTAVASGLEALQVLDRWIPDVLVSDVGMAQMDGYMLLQQIRSRPRDRGGMIPAIALTAYAAEVDQQKALQAGFQTHITKPVDPEALLGAIVSLLRSDR
jgi:signal transduction histidine kinase/ActR/RegA family two-component response regulator